MSAAFQYEGKMLYARRWGFLAGLFIMQFYGGISFASYGQISDFYVRFFGATHSQVDWITNARNVSPIFLTLPLAWFTFQRKLGVRNLTILMCLSSTIGLLLVTVSLLSRKLFALIVIGQLFSGSAEGMGYVMVSSFPALWFPDRQVGTAIAISAMGLYVGDIIGYIVPPVLLYSTSKTANNSTLSNEEFLQRSQRYLLILYGSFTAIAVLVSAMFCVFMTDKPPTPPTNAQEVKNCIETDTEARTSTHFVKETWSLLSNKSYIITCVAAGLVFQIYIVETLMFAEIIGALPKTGFFATIQHNVLSGLVMSVYSIGAAIGLILGGFVVDRCKKYKLLTILWIMLAFVASAIVAWAIWFKISWLIFVGNSLYGFFVGLSVVTIVEISTQLTYPIDEVQVGVWMTGCVLTIGTLAGVAGRAVYTSMGTLAVLIFQSLGLLLSAILISFTSSRKRRLEVEDENRPLVNE